MQRDVRGFLLKNLLPLGLLALVTYLSLFLRPIRPGRGSGRGDLDPDCLGYWRA